jgi:hypothetical protein
MKEVKSEFDIYVDNCTYFEDNCFEIQEKYGGMTVAVSNKGVVAASDRTDEFVNAVKKLNPDDRYGLYVRYIHRKDELVVV